MDDEIARDQGMKMKLMMVEAVILAVAKTRNQRRSKRRM